MAFRGFVFGDPAPRAGAITYLGMPPFRNTSSDPMHVEDVWIARTSANVHVLGYRQYSTDQFGGRFLTSYGSDEGDGDIDFDHARPLRLPYVIPAHASSKRFAMAEVRLTAFPPPGYAKGCMVRYRIGSNTGQHVQAFDCTYYFGAHAMEYFDGRATLTVTNSYPHDVTLLGCAICKSTGVKIQGTPEGGTFLGWDRDPDDASGVTVVVNSRRVRCRPPTGEAARRYEALDGPDLYYEITASARCVLVP